MKAKMQLTREQEGEARADAAQRVTAYRLECTIWPDAFIDATIEYAMAENEVTEDDKTEDDEEN